MNEVAQIRPVLVDKRTIEPELLVEGGDQLFEILRGEAAIARQLGKALPDGAARGEVWNEEDDGGGGPDDDDKEADALRHKLEGVQGLLQSMGRGAHHGARPW